MPGIRKRAAPQEDAEPATSDVSKRPEDEVDSDTEASVQEKPQKRRRKAQTSTRPGTLLGKVKDAASGQALTKLARDWADSSEADATQATAQLFTLLLQACGAEFTVSAEDVEAEDVDKLKRQVAKLVTQSNFVDHFKGPAGRKFRASYQHFWASALQRLGELEALHGPTLEGLQNLLTSLVCSPVRSLRLVASLTAGQVSAAVVHALLQLQAADEATQRQIEAESKRKQKDCSDQMRKHGLQGQAAERRAAFERTHEAQVEAMQALREAVEFLLDNVFINSVGDVAEDIRAMAVSDIGALLAKDAELLQRKHLMHLTNALSDQGATVRAAGAEALAELCSTEDSNTMLASMTQRHARRLRELMHDVDEDVAVKGIQLLGLLVSKGHLAQDEVSQIHKLLVDASPNISHAAAELTSELLESLGEGLLSEGPGSGHGRSAAQRTKNELTLFGVLAIVGELRKGMDPNEDAQSSWTGPGIVEILVARVVDALLDEVAALREWPMMVRLLLDDGTAEQLGEDSWTDLLLVLRCAMHKAGGGDLLALHRPDGRQAAPAKNKAKTAAKQARQDYTLALMPHMGDLLRLSQTSGGRVAAVAAMVPDLSLDIYALRGTEASLEQLLADLAEQAVKHAAADSTRQCLLALRHCSEHGPDAMQEHAETLFADLSTKIAQAVAPAVDAVLQLAESDLEAVASLTEAEVLSNNDSQDEDLHEAVLALARMLQLQLIAPPKVDEHVNEQLTEKLEAVLTDAVSGRPVPVSMIQGALSNRYLHLMWQLAELQKEEVQDPEAASPPSQQNSELQRSLKVFTAHLDRILLEASPPLKAAAQAAKLLCDTLLVFDDSKLKGTPAEGSGLDVTDELLHSCWAHAEQAISMAVRDQPEEPTEQQLPDSSHTQQVELGVSILTAFSRLAMAQAEDVWLGYVASYLTHNCTPLVDMAKDAVRRLKKAAPAGAIEAHMVAIVAGFERAAATSTVEDEDGPFQRLASQVAGWHSGVSAPRPDSLLQVFKGLLEFTFELESRLPCLHGALQLVHKLPARHAPAAAAHLQECRTRLSQDTGSSDDILTTVEQALQDRAAKGKAGKSALKRDGTAAGSARKPARRISFMEAAEGSEEDSENDDIIEDPDAPEEPEASPAPADADADAHSQPGSSQSGQPSLHSQGNRQSDIDDHDASGEQDAERAPSPPPRRPDFRRALQQRRRVLAVSEAIESPTSSGMSHQQELHGDEDEQPSNPSEQPAQHSSDPFDPSEQQLPRLDAATRAAHIQQHGLAARGSMQDAVEPTPERSEPPPRQRPRRE